MASDALCTTIPAWGLQLVTHVDGKSYLLPLLRRDDTKPTVHDDDALRHAEASARYWFQHYVQLQQQVAVTAHHAVIPGRERDDDVVVTSSTTRSSH